MTVIVKGKMDVRFPANIAVQNYITVTRANGTYTFNVDYTLLPISPISNPATAMIAVLDQTVGLYKMVTVSSLIAGSALTEQHLTAAGPVAINIDTGVVRVDQTVGAPMTLNLPLASTKICPVLISDWKADAGTNNITINTTAPDTFTGGLTTWTIASNGGSVFLRPIAGAGYVL